MKARRAPLAVGTPVIIISDFGLACTVGVALRLVFITLIVLLKPAVMTVVVVEEQTKILPLSKSVEIIMYAIICSILFLVFCPYQNSANLVHTQFPVGTDHCILHSCGLRCSLTV